MVNFISWRVVLGGVVGLAHIEAVDATVPTIREEARCIIGHGWVRELVLEKPALNHVLEALTEAAREAGRGVRLNGDLAKHELPRLPIGASWHRYRDEEKVTWRYSPQLQKRWQRKVKRLIDLVVALTLLAVSSPLLVIVAAAVRLSSPGPILYRWRVLGKDGRPFTGYKFRTMVVDADTQKSDLLAHNRMIGPVFKMAGDPRVTAVGRWLRKYSIDELPQLYSVVAGDMSLVGPRPVFPEEYRRFELWQMRKLSVVPGMTCLWQVSGRNDITDFAEWVRLDLAYIDHWSLVTDAKILLRTVSTVLRGTGI